MAYDRNSGEIVSVSEPSLVSIHPSTSGSRVVWRSSDAPLHTALKIADLNSYPIIPAILAESGVDVESGILGPSIDGDVVAFEAYSPGGSDLQIFLARVSDGAIFQATSGPGDHFLANLRGNRVAYLVHDGQYNSVRVTTFDIN